MYTRKIYTASFILAVCLSFINTNALAIDSDAFRVFHRVLTQDQMGEMKSGRLILEITNLTGADAANLVISLPDSNLNQIARGRLQAGSLGAGSIKVIDTEFVFMDVSDMDEMPLMWNIEYETAAGEKKFVTVAGRGE